MGLDMQCDRPSSAFRKWRLKFHHCGLNRDPVRRGEPKGSCRGLELSPDARTFQEKRPVGVGGSNPFLTLRKAMPLLSSSSRS
jgi:hypothetical protein